MVCWILSVPVLLYRTLQCPVSDYISLPDGDDEHSSLYTVDREPDTTVSASSNDVLQQCPDQLDDMLVIVRALRRSRLESMTQSGLVPTVVTSSDMVTPPLAERSAEKARTNNFAVRNYSDLFDFE